MSILDNEQKLMENTELSMIGFPDKHQVIKIECNCVNNVVAVKKSYAYINNVYFKKYWRKFTKEIKKPLNEYSYQSTFYDKNTILKNKIIVVDWLNFRLNKDDDYKYVINSTIYFNDSNTYNKSVYENSKSMILPITIIVNTEEEAQNTSYELITLFKDNPQLVINLYKYKLDNENYILHTLDEIKQFI